MKLKREAGSIIIVFISLWNKYSRQAVAQYPTRQALIMYARELLPSVIKRFLRANDTLPRAVGMCTVPTIHRKIIR